MLLEVFKEGITAISLIELGLYIIIILISLSFHELAHGYVAYRCGDATARNMGRLTINPLAHLDPIGTIMMLFFRFGYAKPVPINPRNFNHFKRDLCFVSFAGPVSNLILAVFGVILYFTGELIIIFNGLEMSMSVEMWRFFASTFALVNTSLCVFNLLPIPPLDGSRIVSTLLPGKWAYYYLKYERYIMIAVMVLLYFGVLNSVLSFFAGKLLEGIIFVVSPIFNFILKSLL